MTVKLMAVRLALLGGGLVVGFFFLGADASSGGVDRAAKAFEPASPSKEQPLSPKATDMQLPAPDRALGNDGGKEEIRNLSIQKQLSDPNPFTTPGQPLWVPKKTVQALHWDFGNVGVTCKLSRTTQQALALSDAMKNAVEQEVNAFLQTVRETELKNVEVVENSGGAVELRIPAGVKVTDAMNRLKESIGRIVGADNSAILMPRLEADFESVTSLIRGEERFISVRLVGDTGVEMTVSDPKLNARSWTNQIPDTMRHLVSVGEDNLKKK